MKDEPKPSLRGWAFYAAYGVLICVAVSSLLFLGAKKVCGQCPTMTTAKLSAFDLSSEDQAGIAVGVSGEYAIVGAHADDPKGTDSGSAYVHRWNGTTWSEQQKLVAADGGAFDFFGSAVAISTAVAIVSSPYDDDKGADAGALYVYRRTGTSPFAWTPEQKLVASDGQAGDNLGWSIATDGTTIVAGAYGDDDRGNYAGAAYVWRYNGTTWVQETKLFAADASASEFFGIGVGVSGDAIIAGAYLDDFEAPPAITKTNAGAAYVFRRTTAGVWSQEAKLTASDPAANDLFGWHVALEGPQALVGSRQSDAKGSESGSAYLFRLGASGWAQEAKLTASDGAAFDNFGSSVALSGSLALVGAYRWEDSPQSDAGAAYLYRRGPTGTWTEETRFKGPDGWFFDEFGTSVSMVGDVAVVGAWKHDTNGKTNAGAAYVFRGSCQPAPPPECTTVADCNDSNSCTADSCLLGRCSHAAQAGACDDGNVCTINDVCTNGVCRGTPITCP
jgi:hypothetical protein